MTKKKTSARKRGRPTAGDKMTKRFMVRCSPEQFARWAAEAERRGFARGNDSGVGRLAAHAMDGKILADAQIAPDTRAGDALAHDPYPGGVDRMKGSVES